MAKISTGITPLDEMLGGGLPPGIILLRGEPGVGKTTLALQVMESVVGGRGDPLPESTRGGSGCFVSLEQKPGDVLRHMESAFGSRLRSLASTKGAARAVCIGPHQVRKALLSAADADEAASAFVKLLRPRLRTATLAGFRDDLLVCLKRLVATVTQVRAEWAGVRSAVPPTGTPIIGHLPSAETSYPILTPEGEQLDRSLRSFSQALPSRPPACLKPICDATRIAVLRIHHALHQKVGGKCHRGKLPSGWSRELDCAMQDALASISAEGAALAACTTRLGEMGDQVASVVTSKNLPPEKWLVARETLVRCAQEAGELGISMPPLPGLEGDLRRYLDAQSQVLILDSLAELVRLVRFPRRGAAGQDEGTGHFRVPDFLHALRRELKALPRNVAAIIIGEYHSGGGSRGSIVGESFLCDTEVFLGVEKVTPARHGTEGALERPNPEERFFCRVMKVREGNRQTRRCNYDFVPGRGLEFYGTYPGDGKIQLFVENRPQMAEWLEFRDRDVLEMYPTLAFEMFDRQSLQRIFASRRHTFYMPQRTDMHLASFDTYWINWYGQVAQRSRLARELAVLGLPCAQSEDGDRDRFAEVVGEVHALCMGSMGQGLPGFLAILLESGVDLDAPSLARLVSSIVRAMGQAKPDIESLVREVRDPAERDVVSRFANWLGQALQPQDVQTVTEFLDAKLCGRAPLRFSVAEYCRMASAGDSFPNELRAANLAGLGPCTENCGEGCAARIEECLRGLWAELPSENLLAELPERDLLLGGERQSRIIVELRRQEHIFNRPAYKAFKNPFEPSLLTVPYNANIGLLACRPGEIRAILASTLGGSAENQQELLAGLLTDTYRRLWCEPGLRGPVSTGAPAAVDRLARRLLAGALPATWEEVLTVCELARPPLGMLFETQTWDTFLATFLELLWASGVDLSVDEAYRVSVYQERGFEGRFELGPDGRLMCRRGTAYWLAEGEHIDILMRPLLLLRYVFARGLCPRDNSFDPAYLSAGARAHTRPVGSARLGLCPTLVLHAYRRAHRHHTRREAPPVAFLRRRTSQQ
jgi:hypothetical protein